jgi:hypothetical protein
MMMGDDRYEARGYQLLIVAWMVGPMLQCHRVVTLLYDPSPQQ